MSTYLNENKSCVGSPYYMAPEIFAGQVQTPGIDVWAFGVCLFEYVYQRQPFESKTLDELQ